MNNIYELEKTNSSESSREKTIIRTSIIGIIANVFLAAFKAVIGIMTHSRTRSILSVTAELSISVP